MRTTELRDVTALALSLMLGVTAPAQAQLTAEEVLERVDANMTVTTAWTAAQMSIAYRDGDVRELAFESWSRGTDQGFLEFTAPARDAGSRFLRRGDAMWIFLPRVGKSVRIQGHMLRQGLMGSDFSYGDASEKPSMAEDYDATIERRDTVAGRPTYVLYLTARRDDLAYPRRRVWVDVERLVPLKEEWFARSGKLLKTAVLSDVRQIDDRWYPFRLELDNALQTDTRTTLQVREIRIGVTIPEEIFSLRHLESGS